MGGLAADSRLRLTVALAPRDPGGLAAYASAVSTPGSSLFHHYLSVAQFAQRFAPDPGTVSAVRAALHAGGLSPGALSANRLTMRVSATAGQAGHAFATSFERLSLPDGQSGFVNTSAPELPASVAGAVAGIVGLSNLYHPAPLDDVRRAGAGAPRTAATSAAGPSSRADASSSSGPTPCASATSAASSPANRGSYTADKIASTYGFTPLYADGDKGSGETVAIYELEANQASDISAYQQCYGTSAAVNYETVDGGPGQYNPSQGDGVETDLDVDNVVSLAPQASVRVYQGPDSGSGPLDTYNAIVSEDVARIVTTSWGQCEPQLPQSDAQAESTLFQEAAVQGQTIVAASGDSGAEDCYGESYSNQDRAAVDDPASQPYVTGVGGTTLTVTQSRTESVWNDSSGASGGGNSAGWTMPSYQSAAASALNVSNAQSSGVPCAAPSGQLCRQVPDVAADADPNQGYLVYWNGNGSPDDSQAWTEIGGTSGSAPVWAALMSLADASSACGGAAVGFANPLLYKIAANDYAGTFHDVTTGNNDWLATNGGQFAAGTGYDQATGLGTPNAATLAPALCGKGLTLVNPGSQSGTVGTPVSLQLQAADASGQTVTYSATGLPPGLSLDTTTGVISGTPSASGSYTVTAQAQDGQGLTSIVQFTWTLAPAASTTLPPNRNTTSTTPPGGQVTLNPPPPQYGQVKRAATLQLLASDRTGATVSYLAQGLPPGLHLTGSIGRISGTPSTAGRYTVTVTATAPDAPSVSARFAWTVSTPPRALATALSGMGRGRPALALTLSAGTDGAPLRTLSIALPRGLAFVTPALKAISLRGARGGRLAFTATVSHGHLYIKLRTGASLVRLTVRPPGIAVTRQGASLARAKRVTLRVSVRDGNGLLSQVSDTVRPH